ncbi:MAG: hypothetical protein KatS3mg061_0649 [Dehalococcoidia bacterium]|nr:MAG: hypothetical protein KatS3mg061_0649 [Dehalococcoidia bacterium]
MASPTASVTCASPAVRHELFRRFGVLVIPVVVVGKQAFFGFFENRAAIERALTTPDLTPGQRPEAVDPGEELLA